MARTTNKDTLKTDINAQLAKEIYRFDMDRDECGAEPMEVADKVDYIDNLRDMLGNKRFGRLTVNNIMKIIESEHSERKYNELMLWAERYLATISNS